MFAPPIFPSLWRQCFYFSTWIVFLVYIPTNQQLCYGTFTADWRPANGIYGRALALLETNPGIITYTIDSFSYEFCKRHSCKSLYSSDLFSRTILSFLKKSLRTDNEPLFYAWILFTQLHVTKKVIFTQR